VSGWSFFRREGYDEFYPGYGSSWPLYTGAVGMTFEQASSRGGAIQRTDGTVLTLQQAARQHYTAAWATALGTAIRRDRRVRDYLAYRQTAIAEGARASLRTVVLERDMHGRADSLARSCSTTASKSGDSGSGTRCEVRRSTAATAGDECERGAGSYVVDLVPAHGPAGACCSSRMRRSIPRSSRRNWSGARSGMGDRFYDLTAFSLPFTFNVGLGQRRSDSGASR
jgi:hypothetical protein